MRNNKSGRNEVVYDYHKEEMCLKITKEIIIKFIETGRLSLSTFEENFDRVYMSIKKNYKKN